MRLETLRNGHMAAQKRNLAEAFGHGGKSGRRGMTAVTEVEDAREVQGAKGRESGPRAPRMVDISEKPAVRREATAVGTVYLEEETIRLIQAGKVEKGDAIQSASGGAIQAVKSTPEWMMMCHPIPIEKTDVRFTIGKDSISAEVTVVSFSKTGVEMEALNGVASALLNVWDVVKKYEKDENGQYPSTRMGDIHVVKKLKATTGV
jgi:cyclic pyranopterin phosphate synthase